MGTSYQKYINSGNTLIILENSFRTNKTIKEAALASFNVRVASLYYKFILHVDSTVHTCLYSNFTVLHDWRYIGFYLILAKCSFANCMSCTSSNVPI